MRKLENNNHKKKLLRINPLIGGLLSKLFLWFLEFYFPDRMTVYSNWFIEYRTRLNKIAECRGKREALNYNKLARLAITRFLSGKPLLNNTSGISLSKDGLPNLVYFLHPKIRNKDKIDLKIIFTMMNLSRGVILKPVDNFQTILNPWEGNLPTKWNTLNTAVRKSVGYRRIRYKFNSLHTSTKSGPNGQAMLTSFLDYLELPDNLLETIGRLGGKEIQRILSEIKEPLNDLPLYQHWFNISGQDPEKTRGLFRKISTFGDKEGKTRVIGILDYWSQTVLRPIHVALEKVLRRIPEDCTFDQSNWYTKLPSEACYYSFDLSAATDRLPVKHQKMIVKDIFGKRVSDAWESLLVEYEFRFGKQSLSYGTGQPMGAYSSWPVMALQHHCLVHYAALLVNINPSGLYVLLGDDIVIANDQLAQSYTAVLKELQVPISEQKTHVSREICEFAKRWYFRGTEITAFPLHSLKNNLKRYYLLQNSISDAEKKGYALSEQSEMDAIVKLMEFIGKKQQKFRIYKLYKLFDAIVSIQKGKSTTSDCIGSVRKVLEANWNIPKENCHLISEENFKGHLDQVLGEYFLDLASEGNIEMSDMMDQIQNWKKAAYAVSPELWSVLRSCHPIITSFLDCWSQRRDLMLAHYSKFSKSKEKLRESLILLGNLPCTSTKIMNARNAHSILSAQSRLVKTLITSLMVVENQYSDSDSYH